MVARRRSTAPHEAHRRRTRTCASSTPSCCGQSCPHLRSKHETVGALRRRLRADSPRTGHFGDVLIDDSTMGAHVAHALMRLEPSVASGRLPSSTTTNRHTSLRTILLLPVCRPPHHGPSRVPHTAHGDTSAECPLPPALRRCQVAPIARCGASPSTELAVPDPHGRRWWVCGLLGLVWPQPTSVRRG